MSDPDCIFCKIIRGEIPAKFVHRDQSVVAIADVNPQAPHHVLLMPVEHVANVVEFARSGAPGAAALLETAASIAAAWPDGFRMVINTGPAGGQTVDHLHVHLLAGRQMAWPPG